VEQINVSTDFYFRGIKQNLNTNRFTNVEDTFIGWSDGSGILLFN
jgi:hypothetical protein